MKKLLAILLLASFGLTAFADSIVVNGTTNGFYLISTNRASITSVELTGANPGTVQLFDSDTVAAPYFGTNYVNTNYLYRVTTNGTYVTNYVGYNGYTNWYTNVGVLTYTLTNAVFTNPLPVLGAFAIAGGTYAVYPADILCVRGISATITTNVTLVINYRKGQ